MKFILILLIALTAYTLQGQNPLEAEVLKISRKKFDWMTNQKFDSLSFVLDERIQYVHSNGWIQSKTEVVEDIRSGKLIYEKIDIQQIGARVYDQTAIVNGRGKFQVKMNGTSATFDLGFTEVYHYQQGRWMLISRHGNRMP